MRTRIALVASSLLVVSGCATAIEDPAPPTPEGQPYAAGVMVMDSVSGPVACTIIQESWPPGCGDPLPIEGWDWAAVDGYEQSGERRWGDYFLRGVIVDGVLHLTRAPSGTPLPRDTGEILQPGHGTGPETGR